MVQRWYRNAAIYSVDVGLFQDSDADGIGDLPGLVGRLDYLFRLGVTTIWLNPIHPSPWRDGGYDVTDHYGVHPRFGSLGDVAVLLTEAEQRGIRVMLDLVVNHTSDEHPWFQSARSDPASPYRDWYVWSAEEPPGRFEGQVFPGVEAGMWSYDEQAGAWYRHRFYSFEPDLNTHNPEVRKEIHKIAEFWLRLGVAGFRVDAVPFIIEPKAPGTAHHPPDYEFLHELREDVLWRRAEAVLLAEANVPDDELLEYFGDADGSASRVMMVFAFRLNQSIMLALAREDASPIAATLRKLPDLPRHAQWATFLRNHDEVDLGRLSEAERQEVFDAFGPDPDMQLYHRGIRRRLAPMLADHRRLKMAYSLQFTMPGTPVVRYGDEIGMGENLSLPEREAIRTPMQWDDTMHAGFSRAAADRLPVPLIDSGPYGYQRVNVIDQRREPNSLLAWFERILHTLRECEEVGTGEHEVIDAGPPHVLVHRARGPGGSMLFLHNLADRPCEVKVGRQPDQGTRVLNVAADSDYGEDVDLDRIELAGYGYRWIRLHRTP